MRSEALIDSSPFDGFVRAEGGQLVDGNGEPLLLRGVALGNWLLPEGYMWKFEDPGPMSPRQIEAVIVDLVGDERAEKFWRAFRDRFVTEDDIAQIAAEGMNHVRLPINSRGVMDDDGALISEGLELIDRTIGWCRDHGLWVVLDLHGAPGGQTGTNIDDSPNGKPELFTEGRYQDQTVALWVALARRYRDEPVVAGYDLLNEPLPEEYATRYADELVALYRRLSAAIREVDPNHLIVYEGTHWATDWSIFTEVWDANSMLGFHKYWSPPDRASLAAFLATRERLGLPIYMGEGGENTLSWLQTAFQLYEDCDISWNFWPWKKLATGTSPCSIEPPAGWPAIVAYAARRGPKPTADDAWRTLTELLDAMLFSRCTYREEVVSAVLRRAPVHIPAAGFGFRGAGVSYETSGADVHDGFRSDDRVTIRPLRAVSFDYTDGVTHRTDDGLVVELRPGDWVAYEVNSARAAALAVAISASGGELRLSVDREPILLEKVGGLVRGVTSRPVGEGRHSVRIECAAGEAVINWLEVSEA